MSDFAQENGLVILCLVGALALFGTGLTVGGVGALHDDCNDSDSEWEPASGVTCADFFRPIWWSALFEIFVVFLIVTVILTMTLVYVRTVLITFLAMASVEVWDTLEVVLSVRDARNRGQANPATAAVWPQLAQEEEKLDTVLAGLILLSIANFVFIITLGIETEARAAPERLPAPLVPPPKPAAGPPASAAHA